MTDQKFVTISKAVRLEGKKIQRIGDEGHYTQLWLYLDPLPKGQGVQFVRVASEERLSSALAAAAEEGVRRALNRDGQEGAPITDVRCSIDGSYHLKDSRPADYDEVAFRTAVDAIRMAGTKPVM